MRKCGVFRHLEKNISFVRASCRLIFSPFQGTLNSSLKGSYLFASTVDLKVLIEDIPNSAISFTQREENMLNQACPEKLKTDLSFYIKIFSMMASLHRQSFTHENLICQRLQKGIVFVNVNSPFPRFQSSGGWVNLLFRIVAQS